MKVTVEFDITKGKKTVLKEFQALMGEWSDDDTSEIDIADLKAKSKGKPAKTVSEEEDEDFATKPLKKKALEEEEDGEEESEEEETEEQEEEEESEDDGISFDEVKEALNKYGNKKPLAAIALLKSFGINNSKELSLPKNKKKLEPVYKKLMGVLKALKKAK